MRPLFPCSCALAACLALAPLCGGGEAPPAGWADGFAGRQPADWAPADGGQCRFAEGTLEVRCEAGKPWATVPLCQGGAAFDLELELRWGLAKGSQKGGFEVGVGPHGVASGGYRFVVEERPWRVVECRGPRLGRGSWHSLSLRVRPTAIEYGLDGDLVARCPVAGNADAVQLRVDPGSEVAVRRCWRRVGAAGDRLGEPRFVYAAEGYDQQGWMVDDALANGGRALETPGRGRGHWLLRGQDAGLPRQGGHVAQFAVRGVGGAGRVWLQVARSGGKVAAARTLLIEELRRDRYEPVAIPFSCEPGELLEYRVAAEGGRLRVDEITVTEAESRDDEERPVASTAQRRVRYARPLADVWGQAADGQEAKASALSVLSLRRRLAERGWYEFQAIWRQDRASRLDGVSVDLWVACRDPWGRIRTFDYGAAYDRVRQGRHATSAWLGPASVERYGSPVAFFAQLYWRGRPVASAWRKWGIPVDDKWILEAKRAGRLRAGEATE